MTASLISLQNSDVMSPRNVCSYEATTRSFKFVIFITFKSCDKTCLVKTTGFSQNLQEKVDAEDFLKSVAGLMTVTLLKRDSSAGFFI